MLSLGQKIAACCVILFMTLVLTVFAGIVGLGVGIAATAVMAPAVLNH